MGRNQFTTRQYEFIESGIMSEKATKNAALVDWIVALVYGLFVIWTGLLRGVEAQAFKPNSFWFCLASGLACLAAGYLFRQGKPWAGRTVALIFSGTVLAFYLHCFVNQPDKDATVRVALVIVASIGFLAVIFRPQCVGTGDT